MANFQPGDPLDDACVMGAIVDENQLKSVMGYIDAGVAEGAALISGGKQVAAESGGYYVAPTVFDQVQPNMKIACEEIISDSQIQFHSDVDMRSTNSFFATKIIKLP